MKLAIGTAQFGLPYGIANPIGQVSANEVARILSIARHHHVDTIDTAIAYGDSETCLGEIGVEQFNVITKLPPIPINCTNVPQWVEAQVHQSLSRLRIDNLYGLLLHKSQDLTGDHGQHLYDTLRKLKCKNIVDKIGVSIYSPNELELITTSYEIDLVQSPLNLIDTRMIQSGWLERLVASGVEVHARSVFLQGLLLMPRHRVPLYFAKWNHLWDYWHHWLNEENISPAEACISYVKSHNVDRLVIGVDSADQFAQLITAASSQKTHNFPNISCNDISLINPSIWQKH